MARVAYDFCRLDHKSQKLVFFTPQVAEAGGVPLSEHEMSRVGPLYAFSQTQNGCFRNHTIELENVEGAITVTTQATVYATRCRPTVYNYEAHVTPPIELTRSVRSLD